ncbi:hypothetical protein [Hymenobacter profundi]|uniref:ATP-binding protein n=1 Tax=Hymenobacter profundi TaxID=1982110 RepID=A0ABS6WVM2_9BACT|nr:hypothetical protein [Hymenobacter profundi]MBW3127655.1 hypothetical protein [Hymenobacter profundi]
MKPERIHQITEVFGISRDIPLNYVERDTVDNTFVHNLKRGKHIVIFGSSKQGKTSLRKKQLKEKEYILIQCSNRNDIREINSNILKRAGYEITVANKTSVSGKAKVVATFKALFGMFDAGAEIEGTKASEKTTAPIELDIEDVNDVIEALKIINFNKYIILEDFHYLKTEVQRDFAVMLKAYHEISKLIFVIVGVWLEENRLIVYNGDLTGRVVTVNADKWSDEELRQVISEGSALLNIKFNDDFINKLIINAFESIYIVQEACYQACIKEKVEETQEHFIEIGNQGDIESIIKSIVNQQSGRYNSFITHFADGFQTTELEMYKWLLYPILKCETSELENGIRFSKIRETIAIKHPKEMELNPGNITQALKNCSGLQVKKNITPIVLDYDQTNLRLNVVDRGFIIWLRYQDKKELLELAGLPDIID